MERGGNGVRQARVSADAPPRVRLPVEGPAKAAGARPRATRRCVGR